VKVVTNNLVTAYDGETVWLGDGTQIKSKTLIWAAGIKGDYPNGFSPK
jgi:NADH dehydrogenase